MLASKSLEGKKKLTKINLLHDQFENNSEVGGHTFSLFLREFLSSTKELDETADFSFGRLRYFLGPQRF